MTIENSKKVAAAAIKIALSESLEEEKALKDYYQEMDFLCAGVNFGGETVTSVSRIIERAVVAAKRENVISEVHAEEGAVAGATHEAIMQILPKAMGLNIGGKIGIARQGDHVSVALVFAIGMNHLNEVACAVAHRAVK